MKKSFIFIFFILAAPFAYAQELFFGITYENLLFITPLVFTFLGIIFFIFLYVKDHSGAIKSFFGELFRKKEKKIPVKKTDYAFSVKDLKKKLPTIGSEIALKNLSALSRKFFGEKLGLDYEFTEQELANRLAQQKKSDWLDFVNRLSELKYAGVDVEAKAVNKLLDGFSSIVGPVVEKEPVLEKEEVKEGKVEEVKVPAKEMIIRKPVLRVGVGLNKLREDFRNEIDSQLEFFKKIKASALVNVSLWFSAYKVKKIEDLLRRGYFLIKEERFDDANKLYNRILKLYYKVPVEQEAKLIGRITDFNIDIQKYIEKRDMEEAHVMAKDLKHLIKKEKLYFIPTRTDVLLQRLDRILRYAKAVEKQQKQSLLVGRKYLIRSIRKFVKEVEDAEREFVHSVVLKKKHLANSIRNSVYSIKKHAVKGVRSSEIEIAKEYDKFMKGLNRIVENLEHASLFHAEHRPEKSLLRKTGDRGEFTDDQLRQVHSSLRSGTVKLKDFTNNQIRSIKNAVKTVTGEAADFAEDTQELTEDQVRKLAGVFRKKPETEKRLTEFSERQIQEVMAALGGKIPVRDEISEERHEAIKESADKTKALVDDIKQVVSYSSILEKKFVGFIVEEEKALLNSLKNLSAHLADSTERNAKLLVREIEELYEHVNRDIRKHSVVKEKSVSPSQIPIEQKVIMKRVESVARKAENLKLPKQSINEARNYSKNIVDTFSKFITNDIIRNLSRLKDNLEYIEESVVKTLTPKETRYHVPAPEEFRAKLSELARTTDDIQAKSKVIRRITSLKVPKVKVPVVKTAQFKNLLSEEQIILDSLHKVKTHPGRVIYHKYVPQTSKYDWEELVEGIDKKVSPSSRRLEKEELSILSRLEKKKPSSSYKPLHHRYTPKIRKYDWEKDVEAVDKKESRRLTSLDKEELKLKEKMSNISS